MNRPILLQLLLNMFFLEKMSFILYDSENSLSTPIKSELNVSSLIQITRKKKF